MVAAERIRHTSRFPEQELRAALLNFWDQKVKERRKDPFSAKSKIEGTVYELVPALDSMTIVRSFVVVGKLLKMKIPVGLVKRGGYDSREEMLDDLIPKIKKHYEKKHKPNN